MITVFLANEPRSQETEYINDKGRKGGIGLVTIKVIYQQISNENTIHIDTIAIEQPDRYI